MSDRFSGRLALQQRVLPSYRVPFFDMLAQACDDGMSLLAGLPRANEGITNGKLQIANYARGEKYSYLQRFSLFMLSTRIDGWLSNWNPDALIVEANPRYLATPSAAKWMHSRGRKVIGWGLGAPPPPLSPPHFQRKWGKQRGGIERTPSSEANSISKSIRRTHLL